MKSISIAKIKEFVYRNEINLFVISLLMGLTAIFIESTQYPGFMNRNGMPPILLFAISTYFYFKICIDDKNNKSLLSVLHTLLLGIFSILFTFLIVTIRMELGGGKNTVQNYYGFNPIYIIWASSYVLFLLFIPFIVKNINRNIRDEIYIKKIIVTFIWIFLIGSQLLPFCDILFRQISRAKILYNKTEAEKIESLWFDLGNFMNFINDNTTSSSSIYHPPQDNPWPEVGNQVLIRRFLYPRTLISPEWGKAEFDYVIFDDGGTYAEGTPNVVGWPTDIFPTKNYILYKNEKKLIELLNVSVNNVENKQLELIEQKSDYEGKIAVVGNKVDADFSQVNFAYYFLSQTFEINSESEINISLKSNEDLNVQPIIAYTNSNKKTNYIMLPPNLNMTESYEINNIYNQIMEFENKYSDEILQNYSIKIGLNIGYRKPMAYLYGKGLITLDKSEVIQQNCAGQECLLNLEKLIFRSKLLEAQLLADQIEPLFRGDPYYSYLRYTIYSKLKTNTSEQEKLLENANIYWSKINQRNLPRNILQSIILE